jgi:large subunit ribosomal protein L4
MEVQLKNIDGQTIGEVSLSESLFAVPFNSSLVHQAMVMYQANRRQGTHSTKTRSEVAGGGAKPWAQKGTGRARQGSIRSPQWRHGGITFGPKPRSHRKMMPKKMRLMALRCMLSQKVKDERLVLVDQLDALSGSTKSMVQALKSLEVNRSALVVTKGSNQDVVRSTNNIPKIKTMPVNLLNAEALLSKEILVMTMDAVREAEGMWGKGLESEVRLGSVKTKVTSSKTKANDDSVGSEVKPKRRVPRKVSDKPKPRPMAKKKDTETEKS